MNEKGDVSRFMDVDIQTLTEDGVTRYVVNGREYSTFESLPPSIRELLGSEGVVDILEPAGADEAPGNGLEELLPGAVVERETTYEVNGRVYSSLEEVPVEYRHWFKGMAENAHSHTLPEAASTRSTEVYEFSTGPSGSSVTLDGRTYRSLDEIPGQVLAELPRDFRISLEAQRNLIRKRHALGRILASLFAWGSYLVLIAWSFSEPESVAPFLFLGLLAGDFLTWLVEVVLAVIVWQSRSFKLKSFTLQFVAVAFLLGLYFMDGSFDVPPDEEAWAKTLFGFVFFLTLCAKTVAICIRRMNEITESDFI